MRWPNLLFVVTIAVMALATAPVLGQPITKEGPTSDGDSTTLTFRTPLGYPRPWMLAETWATPTQGPTPTVMIP